MKKPPSIFQNKKFTLPAIGLAVLAIGLVVVNLFVIGGDQFIFVLNSGINAPLATLVAVSGIVVWYVMRNDINNRSLWLGFLTGWIFWALAEIIWTVYAVSGNDVPYPSIADIFWGIGYIPMGIGLISRARTMPVKSNRRQKIFIFVVSAATVLVAFFLIILPMLREFDPQRIPESILNLVYPLGDLFLLVVVWRLFITYEEGDFGFSWTLITLGFILNIVADFVFTYSTWQGLYYPDMQANLISRMGIDLPYTISYLAWLTGIYAMIILLGQEAPVETGPRVRLVRTYGNILIYTRKDHRVMDVSPNFENFFGAGSVKGQSMSEALGVSPETIQPILEHIQFDGKMAEMPLEVRDQSGNLHRALICGMAIHGPQQVFSGSNILLRIRVNNDSFDARLNDESRRMVRFVLEKSGSNAQAEIGQFLSDYYLAYIKALLDMAEHQGGNAAGQALLDLLGETSKQKNWGMQFQFGSVLDNLDYPLEVLREALPILLDISRQFVTKITSPAAVESRMQKVRAQFSEQVLRDVDYYEKAGHEVGFADHRKGPAFRR